MKSLRRLGRPQHCLCPGEILQTLRVPHPPVCLLRLPGKTRLDRRKALHPQLVTDLLVTRAFDFTNHQVRHVVQLGSKILPNGSQPLAVPAPRRLQSLWQWLRQSNTPRRSVGGAPKPPVRSGERSRRAHRAVAASHSAYLIRSHVNMTTVGHCLRILIVGPEFLHLAGFDPDKIQSRRGQNEPGDHDHP